MAYSSRAGWNHIIVIIASFLLNMSNATQFCYTDLTATGSMEVLATCEADGIEVTWQPLLGSAVKLVQLEYRCREVIALNEEGFDGVANNVLLSESISTSGSRVIPYMIISGGRQIECEISGCTTEGWFSHSYAIPPIHATCNTGNQESSTENYDSIVPTPSIPSQSVLLTSTESLSLQAASVGSSFASLIQPSVTDMPRTSVIDGPDSTSAPLSESTAMLIRVSPSPKVSSTHLINITLVMTPTVIIGSLVLLLALLLLALLFTVFLVIYVRNKRKSPKVGTPIRERSWDYYNSNNKKNYFQNL